MRYSRRSHQSQEELNIWSAFTDLMSNTFMIAMLLLLIAIVKGAIAQTEVTKIQPPKSPPPILVIEDEGAYRFASGSAEIPPIMNAYIKNKIVPEIERNTKEYQINVVEIIGHTDGQGNGSAASNLDQNLEKVANASIPVSQLKAGSNADLGLMRALAVVRVLHDVQAKGQLKGLKFKAYSAAQLILPDGNFASVNRKPDATRRRIEIRFTRPGEPIKVK
ncbi:flagellar motor protein [Chroogloeocystis siderophila 5.2 s.c.1]|jgi:outer membrane protein OmpA-like peptidoglycan-associated protein|uniref:Flagellar motor protein n=2 Tax=Chroogloeocystis TaxID=329162 RepID=A0A1U7HFG0_9CHRO|nr:flagellar motor protein [Chroogloeocystis siderophila]OKH22285.1 flagellar motor protein [Chroogloeocystis siderophila 5.2 s.c.1]